MGNAPDFCKIRFPSHTIITHLGFQLTMTTMDNAMILQNLMSMTGSYSKNGQTTDSNYGTNDVLPFSTLLQQPTNHSLPSPNAFLSSNYSSINNNNSNNNYSSSNNSSNINNNNVDLLTQFLQLQRDRNNSLSQNTNEIYFNNEIGGNTGNFAHEEPDLTPSSLWNVTDSQNLSLSSLQALNPNPINFASSKVTTTMSTSSLIMNNQSHDDVQNVPSCSSQETPPAPNEEWKPNRAGEQDGHDHYAQNGIVGPWSAFSAKLLGDMALTSENCNNQKKRKKDIRDKPKRPLSAYNIFFKEERNRILENIPDADAKVPAASSRKRKKRPHGKIGFESLAKAIGQRWQSLSVDELAIYKEKAQQDMKRYKAEMEVYVSSEIATQLEPDLGVDPFSEGPFELARKPWIEQDMFQL